jgi:competence ComEA-like helix-hairpin-helix protein
MNHSASARRQDQPLKLGAQHGYRIDGDQALIHAEINVPQYHSGGSWALELWASDGERGLALDRSGTRVGEVEFGLATPLAAHAHRVEASVPARLPLQGRRQTMSLALVEIRGDGQRSVHDIASYPELESFIAPRLEGGVGYAIEGAEVVLDAGAITNPRPSDNLSGGLSLELWALPLDAEDTSAGQVLAAVPLGRLSGQESWPAFQRRAAFAEPPVGRWQFALLLREWTQSFGYVTRDRRDFWLPYERTAPDVVAPREPEVIGHEPLAPTAAVRTAPVAPPMAAVAPAKPAAAAVAVKPAVTAKPVIVAPVAEKVVSLPTAGESAAQLRAARALSIQTASVEELAKIKGLNLRIAKDIVKARPFTSVDDLLDVNGIGRKTLDRIRSLIKL